ncbi:hypothetical protein QCA50_003229 [Cerrena zonata]|uniref:Trafficking protein particle complex subunit 10 n=1 Tax=Cerrena zonata TaxID=2478898 RepID=A0AAW0GKA0_9APHY
MTAQRVTVTYTAPATFLATDHWKQAHAALLSQLPLRNLHWKSATRPNIRTIQELDVNLVAADARTTDPTSQIPQTVLEKPLLSVYIVVCDDTDTYRTTVKKQIKEWHTNMIQRKNMEWLIIHIVRPDAVAATGRMFQMKTSVLDKIKADFNVDKRDRCVELVWAYDSQYDNPTAWADLINKLKDGILTSFDTAITQREEEVKRLDGQRQMPGWNFCTFFILKESLANSFEGMNLYDDALDTYNELEILFFQVLREKNLSWFGTIISPSPKDDSLPLLSHSKKPYRDLILANTISVFDFRTYLLARQCAILGYLGRVLEIAKKAVAFLSAFGQRLRELENTLPLYFVEAWTYSSALSVVDQCDAWSMGLEMSKAAQASLNAVKGELVELARHQLDIIGVSVKHLPNKPPFSLALPTTYDKEGAPPTTSSTQKISKGEILASLDDKTTFFKVYVSITNRAIELYATAGRRKFALKMHGDLAALDVHRGRLSSALQTFTSLPAHYAPHGWTSLESYMLFQALDIHAAAEKPKDREWIFILLNFLKAYVQDLGKELLTGGEDHATYVKDLISALHEATRDMELELSHQDHPMITLTIPSSEARAADNRDGALIDVHVTNVLPCDIPANEIIVNLSGRDGAKLTFSETIETLKPGKTIITLFCHSAIPGTYLFHSSQVHMSKLNLQWVHSSVASKSKKPPTLVHIPRDLRALDVRLRQPRRMELGTPACIIVAVSTGRNQITDATIKLTAPSGVEFNHDQASLADDEDGELDAEKDSFKLSNLPADKTILISVPHSDASAFHAMRVNITIEYTTSEEPDIKRTLRLIRVVLTSLPLEINVEDFFRGTRLFTRFTLSSTSHQHIRVKSTELQAAQEDEGLKISKAIPRSHTYTTITPEQPGKFLFQLDSTRGKDREPLKLQITYRVLREEVESVIESAVNNAIVETPAFQQYRAELVDTLVHSLEQDAAWVSKYEATGELAVPGPPSKDGELGEALTHILKLLTNPASNKNPLGEWREIIIPVDVPQMHIVAAARLRVLANPFKIDQTESLPPLFAGQPISALLSIKASFHWAPPEDADKRSYRMRYDIEERTKDWLVSGQKTGEFVAEDDGTFTTSVTLIALHHGQLSLPKVAVTALPIPGEGRMNGPLVPNCETYQAHGAETVLVLPRGGRSTFVVNMGGE